MGSCFFGWSGWQGPAEHWAQNNSMLLAVLVSLGMATFGVCAFTFSAVWLHPPPHPAPIPRVKARVCAAPLPQECKLQLTPLF